MNEKNIETSGENVDVGELMREWERASEAELSTNMALWENTRLAYWAGQDESGKKLDKNLDDKAFPWDKASDTRVRLADFYSAWETRLVCAAMSRATLRVEPIEALDVGTTAGVNSRLKWARRGGLPNFRREVKLSAEYSRTYGWCAVHVSWDRRVGKRRARLALETVAAGAKMMLNLVNFEELVRDEEREGLAADALRGLWPGINVDMLELEPDEVDELGESEARRIVRELRADGVAEVWFRGVERNVPRVTALKPWSEVFVSRDCVELQRARAIFRRDWMTEVELRQRVLTDGWDEAWVDEVLSRTRGQDSQGLRLNWDDETCEVVWGYHRSVDKGNVESVWVTVFSPNLRADQGWGYHEIVSEGNGDYPFYAVARESMDRGVTKSRGVPEIAMTWQQEKKVQRDSCVDRTSISIVPPMFVAKKDLGKKIELSPAGKIGRDRIGEIEWMDPPKGNMSESLALVEALKIDADEYFGRPNPAVSPLMTQLVQQDAVDEFLGCWSEILRHVDRLMVARLSEAEWGQICGAAERRAAERAWRFDWTMGFDVRELDTDFMAQKLEAFVKFAVETDAGGVVDRAKLTRLLANAIDPGITAEVVAEERGASQQVFRWAREQMVQMALGNAPELVENDTTAGMKLRYVDEIVKANPKYQAALQQDEGFREMFEKMRKNLQMSITQEENKLVGRLGV